MTALGRAVLLVALCGLFAGLIRGQATVSALALSTVLWLMLEYAWFQWRRIRLIPRLQFQRVVNDRSDSNGTLQAGRLMRVEVRISTGGTVCHPPLRIEDVLPENIDVQQSAHEVQVSSAFRSAI